MNAQVSGSTRRVVTIPLSRPTEWLGNVIREVKVKEPNARDFFEIGDLQVLIQGKDGHALLCDVPDALMRYTQKCVDVEQAEVFLNMLALADGRAIKRALYGFFRDVDEVTSG